MLNLQNRYRAISISIAHFNTHYHENSSHTYNIKTAIPFNEKVFRKWEEKKALRSVIFLFDTVNVPVQTVSMYFTTEYQSNRLKLS